MTEEKTCEQLLQENIELQARLEEAENALRAIRTGEVDALVVSTPHGNRVFVLQSADLPYRLLVEQMQQGAVTISTEGTILFCNACFAELTGHTANTLVSQPIEQYIALSDRDPFKVFLGGVPVKLPVYREFGLQHRNGQIIPVYVSGNSLDLDLTGSVLCLIFTDLRARKEAEAQTAALEIEKQRMRVLRDFVRDMSHDLRTPLSVIMTGLGNLEYTEGKDKRAAKIHKIEQYVIYLNNVLEQLQQTAVLDNMIDLPLQYGEPNTTILEAVASYTDQAREKNITLSSALVSPSPSVCFDRDMLYRALAELIGNSIRFTPQGGHILVQSAVVDDTWLRIEVSDDGSGISPESLPSIFERFFKGDKARSVSGGAGLGLPIAKRIVELHRGSIEVTSTPGYRTTFAIMLPLPLTELPCRDGAQPG